MKRRFALLPLMAVTALSLTLAACDENGAADESAQASGEALTGESSMPAADATAQDDQQATQSAVMHADTATAFATAEGMRTGAIFLRLHNPNATADTLLSAASDKATIVELHESYVDETDGTMQMRKVPSIEIPANGEVMLKPGGLHIMLIDLLAPLVEGETFNVTLRFENAGEMVVPVTVTAPGAMMDSTHNHGSAAPDSTVNGTNGASESATPPISATDEPMPAETGAEVPADAPASPTPAEEAPATDGTVSP